MKHSISGKKIKAWGVVHQDEDFESFIDGAFQPLIFNKECKVFADKFAEARNKANRFCFTKVVPVEIRILPPKKKNKRSIKTNK